MKVAVKQCWSAKSSSKASRALPSEVLSILCWHDARDQEILQLIDVLFAVIHSVNTSETSPAARLLFSSACVSGRVGNPRDKATGLSLARPGHSCAGVCLYWGGLGYGQCMLRTLRGCFLHACQPCSVAVLSRLRDLLRADFFTRPPAPPKVLATVPWYSPGAAQWMCLR